MTERFLKLHPKSVFFKVILHFSTANQFFLRLCFLQMYPRLFLHGRSFHRPLVRYSTHGSPASWASFGSPSSQLVKSSGVLSDQYQPPVKILHVDRTNCL